METLSQRRKRAVMDSSEESSSSSSELSSESASSFLRSSSHMHSDSTVSSVSSPSSASSTQWTSTASDSDNSSDESYRFKKGENVWGRETFGGRSKWRWCKLLQGSNPRCFASSSSYLVEAIGRTTSSFWVSRRYLLPHRDYVKKFNRGATKRKRFAGRGTVAAAQVTASQGEQESQLPVKKTMSLLKPQENLEAKSTPMRKSNKENTPFTKPEQTKNPGKRWFPFVPVKKTSANTAQQTVSHFSAHDTQLSLMHEQSIITLIFISGLRKNSTPTYGLDDDENNVTLRQSQLTFSYRPSDVFNASVPGAFLIISICKKPSVLPAVEYHPKCLRMFLNDRMVHTRIPDGQAPYPVVPLEVPLSALQTTNELLISWTESTPDDLGMDYCVHVYLAKRKQLSSIVTGIQANVLPVAKSLMQERTRDGTDQDIVAGTRTLKLNCPVSKKRIVLPVRGAECRHLECFDAFSYLSINIGATARFLCPLCAQIVLPRDLLVDAFFMEILSFTSEERIELVQDRTGITVQEYIKEARVVNLTRASRGPTGFITIDDNNDGRVICID